MLEESPNDIGQSLKATQRRQQQTLELIRPGDHLLSEPVVRLFFQRGAFTAADTRVVAQVQAFYVIQIPFYVLNMIMVRLLSAMHRNHILMISGSLNLCLNVAFNLLFIRIWGVAGIALSSSAVTVLSFVLLLLIVSRSLQTARAQLP